MRYSPNFVLAVGMIALSSCGKAPPLATAEDLQNDQAVAQVTGDQELTLRAQTNNQTIAAEPQQERLSSDTIPVIEVRGRPHQQSNRKQYLPPEIQILTPPGNTIVQPSRTGN